VTSVKQTGQEMCDVEGYIKQTATLALTHVLWSGSTGL
jgi:hypothetical protein